MSELEIKFTVNAFDENTYTVCVHINRENVGPPIGMLSDNGWQWLRTFAVKL